jgi:AraC-like DNA-binding protein
MTATGLPARRTVVATIRPLVRPDREPASASRWVAGRPHAGLRRLVPGGYLGFRDVGDPHYVVLPATVSVPLVVKLKDSAYRPPQFVLGAHDAVVVPAGRCAPSYVQLRLAPLAAFTVLNTPARGLAGDTVDLVDVLGAPARQLAEQLREETSWSRRFALLDAFLLRRLDEGPRPAAEVRRAWRRLVTSGGSAPIGALAHDVGWSHKHLISKFKEQLGLAPKTAGTILRFEHVMRRIETDPRIHWGQIAAEAGYADQAHLIRDFHRFTGGTPGQFLALATAEEPPPVSGLPESV